jgi:hypothetical protein
MGAVTTLCQRGIWLEAGRVVRSGPAREVINEYLTTNRNQQESVIDLGSMRRIGEYGRKFRIERLEWLSGLPLQHGEKISVRIHFHCSEATEEVGIGLGFSTLEGVRLLTFETDFQNGNRPNLEKDAGGYVDLNLNELPLAPGLYNLDVGARSGDSFGLDYLPGFLQIEIAMGLKTPGYIVRQGAGVRLVGDWHWKM